MQKRKNCRKYFKELRYAMNAGWAGEASVQICDRILFSAWYRNAEVILGYYPLGNEVNTLPVLKQALADGKRVALPKTGRDDAMEFYEIKDLSEDVSTGAFGIMEPVEKEEFKITGEEIVSKNINFLALVPGVAFDRTGNRYGYGKGFYDRYFARFPQIYRMALAYEIQLSEEELDTLPTDVKMHGIVTEKEMIEIG